LGLALQLTDHVVHGVEAGLLVNQEHRGLQRARRKDAAVLGAVADADALRRAEEAHLMLARHRAAADGKQADLVFVPALGAVVTAVDRHALGIFDGVIEHIGGAAGSVQLLVVVLFHDLDIKAGEQFRSLFAEQFEHMHAKAQIGASENGNLSRCR